MEAYSPLGNPAQLKQDNVERSVLENADIVEIATKHSVSAAQVHIYVQSASHVSWRSQVQIPLKAAHLFSLKIGDCFECFHLLCLVLLRVHVEALNLCVYVYSCSSPLSPSHFSSHAYGKARNQSYV